MAEVDLTPRQKALLGIYHHPGVLERPPDKIAKYKDAIRSENRYFLYGVATVDMAFLREMGPGIAQIDMVKAYPCDGKSESVAYDSMDMAFSYVKKNLKEFLAFFKTGSDFLDSCKQLQIDAVIASYRDDGMVVQCKRLPELRIKRELAPKNKK